MLLSSRSMPLPPLSGQIPPVGSVPVDRPARKIPGQLCGIIAPAMLSRSPTGGTPTAVTFSRYLNGVTLLWSDLNRRNVDRTGDDAIRHGDGEITRAARYQAACRFLHAQPRGRYASAREISLRRRANRIGHETRFARLSSRAYIIPRCILIRGSTVRRQIDRKFDS